MNLWATTAVAFPSPPFPSLLRLPQKQHFSQSDDLFLKKLLPVNTTIIGQCSSSTSQGAASASFPNEENGGQDASFPHQNFKKNQQNPAGFWMKWKENSGEMSRKLAKLGLSAVLAYGLFDAFTYTTFFVLAFLGYEKSTGNNPAANLKALLGIVILMWTGNNVTRPFRVAGAAGLAPLIDKGLRRLQTQFNFPNLAFAFALVVAIVAASCFSVVGLLILSRWGK